MRTSICKIDDYDNKKWYNDKGELHNTNGPAIIWNNGDKYWLINGELNRIDGPAIENAKGERYWYINGEMLTEQEFNTICCDTQFKQELEELFTL
jgi:hypothetical protein